MAPTQVFRAAVGVESVPVPGGARIIPDTRVTVHFS